MGSCGRKGAAIVVGDGGIWGRHLVSSVSLKERMSWGCLVMYGIEVAGVEVVMERSRVGITTCVERKCS